MPCKYIMADISCTSTRWVRPHGMNHAYRRYWEYSRTLSLHFIDIYKLYYLKNESDTLSIKGLIDYRYRFIVHISICIQTVQSYILPIKYSGIEFSVANILVFSLIVRHNISINQSYIRRIRNISILLIYSSLDRRQYIS